MLMKMVLFWDTVQTFKVIEMFWPDLKTSLRGQNFHITFTQGVILCNKIHNTMFQDVLHCNKIEQKRNYVEFKRVEIMARFENYWKKALIKLFVCSMWTVTNLFTEKSSWSSAHVIDLQQNNQDSNHTQYLFGSWFCKPSSLYHDSYMRTEHRLLALCPTLFLPIGM